MKLNGLVINGRVLVIYMMALLGFSSLKVFLDAIRLWTWFDCLDDHYGRIL